LNKFTKQHVTNFGREQSFDLDPLD